MYVCGEREKQREMCDVESVGKGAFLKGRWERFSSGVT